MRAFLAALLLAFSALAAGQSSEIDRPDPAVEARLKALAEELRCLVCQNQTILDSNAPLALDLRNQIRTQVAQGRTDDQIREYMVQRYGDFVLYKPPLKGTTAVLWIGPLLLLLGGAAIYVAVLRRRRAAGPGPVAPQKRAELEKLLEAGGDPDGKSPP